MTLATLGIGSNYQATKHIELCLDELLLRFNDLTLSSVFASSAVGFANHKSTARSTSDGMESTPNEEDSKVEKSVSSDYLNMVVALETNLSAAQLVEHLKALEYKLGRRPEHKREGRVPIDIDLLTFGKGGVKVFGKTLPSEEILKAAYVLWPLSQVIPRQRHPQSGLSYSQHWKEFSDPSQQIRPVDFNWHGRQLSLA